MKTVPELLRDAASIHEQRNEIYGANYKKFGNIMTALFPNGLKVKTKQDFDRLGVLIPIVSKIGRYAQNFDVLGGHPDSLDDIAVYAMMLRELDAEMVQSAEQAKASNFGINGFIQTPPFVPAVAKRDWLSDAEKFDHASDSVKEYFAIQEGKVKPE